MSYKKADLFNLLLFTITALVALWVAGAFKKADAAEANLSWAAPTQNCNGTPLTDLTGYTLTYGQARVSLPPTPLSYAVKGLTPGEWWFSLAAVKGADSSEFVTVSKTIPPEEFVTLATPVYSIAKNTDRLILVPVGTVPLGTRCDATQNANGHYAVPRAAVTWSSLVRPSIVVAKCS